MVCISSDHVKELRFQLDISPVDRLDSNIDDQLDKYCTVLKQIDWHSVHLYIGCILIVKSHYTSLKYHIVIHPAAIQVKGYEPGPHGFGNCAGLSQK